MGRGHRTRDIQIVAGQYLVEIEATHLERSRFNANDKESRARQWFLRRLRCTDTRMGKFESGRAHVHRMLGNSSQFRISHQ